MSADSDRPAVAWWQVRRDAADDVRPFTDFGQFGYGRLDRRVFWQDIYWVDLTGTPHFLIDMTPQYRANVIGFLQRTAAGWWSDEVAYLTLEAATLVLISADEQKTIQVVDHLDALVTKGPEDWMASSPLMRRLRALPSEADT